MRRVLVIGASGSDTIVWIDLPLALTLARLARRTAVRYVARTALWNGNREELRNLFWGATREVSW